MRVLVFAIRCLIQLTCVLVDITTAANTIGALLELGSIGKALDTTLDVNFALQAKERLNNPELEFDRLDPIRFMGFHGFNGESHYVTTKDGYILNVFRVINPFANQQNAHLKPVILHHGLFMSCYDFMINDQGGKAREPIDPRNYRNVQIGNNLAFELSNLGFDVWLGNSRGNQFSENHTTMDPATDKNFWKFSVDQMASQDTPAFVKYVLNNTGHSEFIFYYLSYQLPFHRNRWLGWTLSRCRHDVCRIITFSGIESNCQTFCRPRTSHSNH